MLGLKSTEDSGRWALIALIAIIMVASIVIGLIALNNLPQTVQISSDTPIKLGDAVHAYTQDGQMKIFQQNLSPNGNTVTATVNGYILNPLNNSDPTSDYYVFNILLAASSQNGWYVTSDDLSDVHGPLIELSVTTPPNEYIIIDQISPSGLTVNNGGNKPQTIAVSMSISPVTFGASYTLTPSISKTEPTVETANKIAWAFGWNHQTVSRHLMLFLQFCLCC